MRTKIFIGLATLFMYGNVCAQLMIDPAYFYDQCLYKADVHYAQCARSGPYSGPCINLRIQEQQSCQAMLQNMRYGGAPSYAPQAYDGRFYPTPIPQRPVYVLPGAR